MSDTVSAEPDLIRDLLTEPIPKHLWHYTSYAGLQGIVESKKIYATDVRYLNDRQEFVHAKELAAKLAEEVVDSSDAAKAVSGMQKNAVGLAFDTGPLRADRLQVMVASFSDAQDQLSQWRGYSGASSGVSVSFDLSKIRPPSGVDTGVVFAPCVYDLKQKKALLQRALSHMVDTLVEWTGDVKEAIDKNRELLKMAANPAADWSSHVKGPPLSERLQLAMTKVNFDLVRICPLLKDSSFSEEREWRLVLPISMNKQLQVHPRQYRPARDTLVPYIEYPLCRTEEALLVNDLILGPGSHVEAKAATFSFLQANNIMVMPRASEVPYRPW
jgi:hypothetical protein